MKPVDEKVLTKMDQRVSAILYMRKVKKFSEEKIQEILEKLGL